MRRGLGLGLGFGRIRARGGCGAIDRVLGQLSHRARVRGRRAFKRAWLSRCVRGNCKAEWGGSGGGGAEAERGTGAERGSAAVLGPATDGAPRR